MCLSSVMVAMVAVQVHSRNDVIKIEQTLFNTDA